MSNKFFCQVRPPVLAVRRWRPSRFCPWSAYLPEENRISTASQFSHPLQREQEVFNGPLLCAQSDN